LSDDLLRGVLARLGRSRLAGVAQAVTDLRLALDEALGPPHSDRHSDPISAPRSGARMRLTRGTTKGAAPAVATAHPARKD
jgi:hypothetical protein